MQPKVSVILAAYNHERFVARSIESVLQQSFRDFELLVADDGSPDNTARVIKSFADPRLRGFYFQENGYQHTRNFCLQHARGSYIAIQNSDDVYHPERLEKQVRILDSRPEVAAVFSWITLIDERDVEIPKDLNDGASWFNQPNRSRHEWLRILFEKGNHLCHPTVLFRRSVLDNVGHYSPLLALTSDYDLWVRIALKHEIHVIPERLVSVRILDGEANASGRRPSVLRRSGFEISKVLEHFASDDAAVQLEDIFPELSVQFAGKSLNARKFLLGLHAASMPQVSHKLFGLNLMFRLLSQPEVAAHLHSEIGPSVEQTFRRCVGERSPTAESNFASARLFWPQNGIHDHSRSNDALVPWNTPTVITFRNIPANQGDQLLLAPLEAVGFARLKRIIVRDEKTNAQICEYILPHAGDALVAHGDGELVQTETFTTLICYSENSRVLLPPVTRTGTIRVEVQLEATNDWRETFKAAKTANSSHNQNVSVAKRLRTSLVNMFARDSRSRT